jgi:L-ascorbate metabolism protein UlaG (beta-lactamase superfamily)
VDVILLSHGHDDHSADVVGLARASGAPVVCLAELNHYLTAKGLRGVRGMNIGGTQEVDGIRITMTMALHSGSLSALGFGLSALGSGLWALGSRL